MQNLSVLSLRTCWARYFNVNIKEWEVEHCFNNETPNPNSFLGKFQQMRKVQMTAALHKCFHVIEEEKYHFVKSRYQNRSGWYEKARSQLIIIYEVQKIRAELFTNQIQRGIRLDKMEFVPEIQGRFSVRKLLPCIAFADRSSMQQSHDYPQRGREASGKTVHSAVLKTVAKLGIEGGFLEVINHVRLVLKKSV